MGIRVKMGQYEADEEWAWPVKVLGGLGVAAVACIVGIVVYLLGGGADNDSSGVALAMAREAPAVNAVSEPVTPFASTNWDHLPRGDDRKPITSLDTDVDSPDWENYEALKELKAMAIYEAKAATKSDASDAETTRKLLEQLK